MKQFLAFILISFAAAFAQSQTALPSGTYYCAADCTISISQPAASAPAATVSVSGVPTVPTTATSLAIPWSVDPAGTTVWCRRDTYAPGKCPTNPFSLGFAPNTPLSVGTHTVDFWTGTTTPDLTKAAPVHKTWTIIAPPVVIPPPVVVTPPVGTSMTQLGSPNQIINNYASGSWDGKSTVTASDAARIVTYASAIDPLGSYAVQLHRIHTDYAISPLYSGARAELAWQNTTMDIGKEYWIGFGFYQLPGEPSDGDSAHIVFQTHSQQGGNTTPDTYVQIWPAFGTMSIGTAYNANDPATWSYNGGSNGDTTGSVNIYGNDKGTSSPVAAAMPKAGTWTKVIIRKIPGYLASQNPMLQVWVSFAGGAYAQVGTYTGPNTYNVTSTIKPSLNTPQSYPRKGIYYFQTSSSTQWPMPSKTLAYYMTPLFFQQGTNMLTQAEAALAPYGVK